jgi:hypothetical protein
MFRVISSDPYIRKEKGRGYNRRERGMVVWSVMGREIIG